MLKVVLERMKLLSIKLFAIVSRLKQILEKFIIWRSWFLKCLMLLIPVHYDFQQKEK